MFAGRSGVMRNGVVSPLPALSSINLKVRIPTPTAQDGIGSRNATSNRKPGAKANLGYTLTDFVSLAPEPGTRPACAPKDAPKLDSGLKINPAFSEWLMGFPTGYTVLTQEDS